MAVIVNESPWTCALTPRAEGMDGVDLRNASALFGQEPGAQGPLIQHTTLDWQR